MQGTTTITATRMHKQRGEIIRRCWRKGEKFIVEKDGMPIIAIIPINELKDTSNNLNAVYAAFGKVCGTIEDPSMQDASSTIDVYVYQDDKPMEDYVK